MDGVVQGGIRVNAACRVHGRPLILIVHLPPGAKEKERSISLDFFEPWQNVFLDDLRPADTVVLGRRCPSIDALLHEGARLLCDCHI
jgi:hypothetical protein